MIEVRLDDIEKSYPRSSGPAICDLSLHIPQGELVSLLGPSGCGKTTTLKIIAGLLEPDRGKVLFGGSDVTGIPAEDRDAVMVFQNHLLFPFLSVEENVGFGLRMQGVAKDEIRRRVVPMLHRMQLSGYEKRRPSQLSGGERQRVALATALVLEPKVLLLDEPLSNLDESLRDEMRELILSIKDELDLTIIFVTHDQEEAVLLADRIAIMFDGFVVQYGTPDELYRRPATLEVARFFGNGNYLEGVVTEDGVRTAAGLFPSTDELRLAGEKVTVLIRPEEIRLERRTDGRAPSSPEYLRLETKVLRHVYMGTHRRYTIDVAGRRWTAVDRSGAEAWSEGDRVDAVIPAPAIRLVNAVKT